ncbi:family 43 glycoside hydrolase [Microdochium trichocladiopsis]|uniref:Family 43 glycoside hydrolase n=1 Tax=Microdochium trichocladiopsis TaxID=1682393 RepID=A0A9P8Y6K7_9PEZI|nr:family 43 glycoside hydrolase [Microdochium trichocladiopsis]KAH7030638.1 family 43 glycoside hydrolase [Microdochium trichocladiopsis]
MFHRLSSLLLFLDLTASAFSLPNSHNAPHAPFPRQEDLGPNPIDPGWYADPDAIKTSNGTYFIYATLSIAFDSQTTFDAFSASSLAGPWTKHPAVFDPVAGGGSAWANRWLWAPCTVERDGKFWFYYTANDPIDYEDTAGIGVAVSDSPAGPFVDAIDRPLIGKRYGGANAMDQQAFRDPGDGKWYLIWGGSFTRIVPLGDDMASIAPWDDDGSTEPRDITPNEGFGEGSYMLKRGGWYYLMWSEGGYGTPDYRVAYARSESLLGPFVRIGLILDKGDSSVADGPGHHSIIKEGEDEYYIVYHRRILGDTVADHRVLAVDRLVFDEDGWIEPVVMH